MNNKELYCYELKANFGPAYESQKIDYILNDKPISREDQQELLKDWYEDHRFQDPIGRIKQVPLPSLDFLKREISHQEGVIRGAQDLLLKLETMKARLLQSIEVLP